MPCFLKAALGCDFLKIYVFRHGETDWNAQHRIQGRTDVPLNKNGIRQAEDMGRSVAGKIKPEYMIVSDLSRAQDTGKIIAGFLGIDRIYTEHDLTECSYEMCIRDSLHCYKILAGGGPVPCQGQSPGARTLVEFDESFQ